MASYNKVILLGNLTRDPELRYTPKGTASARLGLAVNRSYKTDTGETREEVTFVDIDAWGKQAELIAQYLRKGNPLFVEGRLKLDQWDDKTSGQKRSAIRVVMENFQFVGGRAEGRPAGGPPSSGHSAPASPASAPASGGDSGHDGPPPEEDDVPF
ncbi:MAG: single-stranded DNA-binding protein [Verrucomicrobiales bacterium]|nr:single-stranded DNA-binding protein [Verrucomicrobiales bacterium]